MTETTMPPLTLRGFAFQPRHPEREVAAFSIPFRILAWALLLGLGAWMLGIKQAYGSNAAVWGMAAWAMMAWTVWNIQRSRTRLSAEGLRQTWIWNKQMAMADLAYAHLIRVRMLDWLIAPRLYVRSLSGRFTVIYCADPEMLEDMARLSRELYAFHTRA
jgi:hypothetical protein